MGLTAAAPSGSRVLVGGTNLLAAVALLLACAPAHAQSARSGADRLRITAHRGHLDLAYGAVVTATGTVGRRGDADATTLPINLYAGRVLVIALPRTQSCPRAAPRPDPPHSDFDDVTRRAIRKRSPSPTRSTLPASCAYAAT